MKTGVTVLSTHGTGLHLCGNGTVVVTIQADDFGENVSVSGVALRPRGGVPFPISRCRQRIDRKDLVTSRAQRRHPRTPIGLDPDDHLACCLFWSEFRRRMLGHQRVERADAVQTLRQAGPSEPVTVLALHLDVMVVLSPASG